MNAASKYLARLYETAVDSGLDVGAIRLHLASHGVARSPAMVRHELDNVFSFCGYADSHPAPVEVSQAEFDRQIGS